MKKKGDYTLYIGDENEGRKITFIEWRKQNSGRKGDKILKTFYIKYISAHYPDEYKYIGMVSNFKLRENTTMGICDYKIKTE